MAHSTAARQGCCVALGLGEDNARFLLLFVVMLVYIVIGATIFSLLERNNEIESTKITNATPGTFPTWKMIRKRYRRTVNW